MRWLPGGSGKWDHFELTDLLKVCVKHQADELYLMPHLPPIVRLGGELVPVGTGQMGERCAYLLGTSRKVNVLGSEFAVEVRQYGGQPIGRIRPS